MSSLNTLKPRESRYDPDLARRLNEQAELEEKREALKGKKKQAKQPPQPVASPTISTAGDSWKISGVQYRNGIYTVDLSKQLLPSATQDKHALNREQAIANNGFYVADMPLYHALFTALFKQKDSISQVEEVRAFIQKSMRESYPLTLTRIAYQPIGKDKIIHNYGTRDQYEIEEKIVGPDRTIQQADSKALEAILGTGNIQEIEEVYNWINQTPVYIWRVNKKPQNIDERVARFSADPGRVGFGLYGDLRGSYSAFGVRFVA